MRSQQTVSSVTCFLRPTSPHLCMSSFRCLSMSPEGPALDVCALGYTFAGLCCAFEERPRKVSEHEDKEEFDSYTSPVPPGGSQPVCCGPFGRPISEKTYIRIHNSDKITVKN